MAPDQTRLRPLSAALAALALALLLLLPAASSATMPGLNGRIAFQKGIELPEGGFESSIWSMNPDGSGATRLASLADANDPAYSADGSRLAFGRSDQVFVAAADGSGAKALTLASSQKTSKTRWIANYQDPQTATVYPWVKVEEMREARDARFEPSFSPDGAALAVVHYTGTYTTDFYCSVSANNSTNCTGAYTNFVSGCENCGSGIEAIDATSGAVLATLVPRVSAAYVSGPVYSSTGGLAYTRETEASPSVRQLLYAAAPGSPPVPLASGQPWDPDFSPDGSRVVFSSGNHEIGIVAVTGGAPTTIPIPPPTPNSKAWIVRRPLFSPDGSQIALGNLGLPGGGGFERYSEGGVFLMAPDGSGLRLIQGDATLPNSWQPIPLTPARAVKGKKKIRLTRKGVAVVGQVVCGSTPCSLKATSQKLKLGKKRFGVKAILPPALAAGATAALKVKVKGKALAALKKRRGGKLLLSLAIADSGGPQALRFTPKLLPPKPKKKKNQGTR